MNIAVIGLGLIGGSFAKALKHYTTYKILGFDTNEQTMQKSLDEKAIDGIAGDGSIGECDMVIIALYPKATTDFIIANAPKLKQGCIIVDTCGVKRAVVERAADVCARCGLIFIGGHPMAGREFWGFDYSLHTLFKGASMILTPSQNTPEQAIRTVAELFYHIGFGKVVNTSAENHDRMIAYTSQLAHVVSSAYIKSPAALEHTGYSAGSYKDLTRVAKLNENMWTELFLDNGDYLVQEIDLIIDTLKAYSEAIKSKDEKLLRSLLKEGREIKERIS